MAYGYMKKDCHCGYCMRLMKVADHPRPVESRFFGFRPDGEPVHRFVHSTCAVKMTMEDNIGVVRGFFRNTKVEV